jgi:hypothetical protein
MKAFATMTAIIVAVTAMPGCAHIQQGAAQTGSISFPSSVVTPSAGTDTNQITAVGVPKTLVGAVPVAVQTPSLADILVQQLGIAPEQAAGGSGAIFFMAKQGMSSTDFAQVINAVLGMNQYLAAPSQVAPSSGTGGLMGIAGKALGDSASALSNMALLADSFQSLGLNSGMVSQFIPIILHYMSRPTAVQPLWACCKALWRPDGVYT